MVPPDAASGLQTLAKALVIACVVKAPCVAQGRLASAACQGQGTAAQEGRPVAVDDRIARHTVQWGESYEISDCCGGDHRTMHDLRKLRRRLEPLVESRIQNLSHTVLETICPEGRLIRAYGWSDLRDVSGRIEGVAGVSASDKNASGRGGEDGEWKGWASLSTTSRNKEVRLPVARVREASGRIVAQAIFTRNLCCLTQKEVVKATKSVIAAEAITVL